MSAAVSRRCPGPRGRSPRVAHPCAAPPRKGALDLHVLGAPPAFVLSQDQTLSFASKERRRQRRRTRARRTRRPRVPSPNFPTLRKSADATAHHAPLRRTRCPALRMSSARSSAAEIIRDPCLRAVQAPDRTRRRRRRRAGKGLGHRPSRMRGKAPGAAGSAHLGNHALLVKTVRTFSDWGWGVKPLLVPAVPVGRSLLSTVGALAAA